MQRPFLRSTSFIDILNGTGLFDTGNQYVRCESVEGKKYDEVQKISIGLIALWFLFLTAATFWSVKEENKRFLPSGQRRHRKAALSMNFQLIWK